MCRLVFCKLPALVQTWKINSAHGLITVTYIHSYETEHSIPSFEFCTHSLIKKKYLSKDIRQMDELSRHPRPHHRYS